MYIKTLFLSQNEVKGLKERGFILKQVLMYSVADLYEVWVA